MKNRGKILWIDDEIQHLKPHILFLEEKGYSLTTVTNGQDGAAVIKENNFDLVLLDQTMPGMDGLQTLIEIKKITQNQLIIMITKTEDEWLMDEAIHSQVDQFLIKPVNPSQIFMACKQALEKNNLQRQKATSDYLKEFHNIEMVIKNNQSADDWFRLYNQLVDWQIKFDNYKDIGLINILNDQIKSCNKEFVNFYTSNYQNWLNTDNRPLLSNDIIKKFLSPLLKKDKKVCLLVVDCMRLDHLKAMSSILEPIFNIKLSYAFSLIPTATQYSRNAIFSGMFPDEMVKKYQNQADDMKEEAQSLNQHEKQFLIDNLNRLGHHNKSLHYHKIWAAKEGRKFENKIKDYIQKDLLALVVNFVDILTHKSAQMDVLKELVPDESGYRSAIKSWFEHSWLLNVLKYLGDRGWTIVITSDHGSVKVKNNVMVAADRDASSGLRFKFGRNLNTNEKHALIIKNPADYKLPEFGYQPSYVIAKHDNYFVYPNDAHKYQTKFNNTFQHGGISMEEVIVPVAILNGRT